MPAQAARKCSVAHHANHFLKSPDDHTRNVSVVFAYQRKCHMNTSLHFSTAHRAAGEMISTSTRQTLSLPMKTNASTCTSAAAAMPCPPGPNPLARHARSRWGAMMGAVSLAAAMFAAPVSSWAASDIVISQVYGGGGDSGAPYTHDFVELFNRSGCPIDITGWSIQYQTAGGTTWAVVSLTAGSIPPGKYHLVQLNSGGTDGVALPAANSTSTLDLSATAGKIALVGSTTALADGCPATGIADKVGYGTTSTTCNEGGNAPAPSATVAILRAAAGCTDTDDNSSDFATGN